jgi:hypothetical protein
LRRLDNAPAPLQCCGVLFGDRPVLKHVLILFAAAALPSAAAAQTAPAAPSEAQVARFIAALPDSDSLTAGSDAINPELLAQIQRANPGRETEAREVVAAHGRCTQRFVVGATERMFVRIAHRLGAARVEALIRFYGGPEFAPFSRIGDKMKRDEALTAAEQAELARIMSAYPLNEFFEAMEALTPTMAQDAAFIEGVTGCAGVTRAELGRRGLRLN